MLTLLNGDCGTYMLVNENGEETLVQSDWDFPSTATTFGWVACPYCTYTDGTVDCDHRTASEMIADAREFLDDHIGDVVETYE